MSSPDTSPFLDPYRVSQDDLYGQAIKKGLEESRFLAIADDVPSASHLVMVFEAVALPYIRRRIRAAYSGQSTAPDAPRFGWLYDLTYQVREGPQAFMYEIVFAWRIPVGDPFDTYAHYQAAFPVHTKGRAILITNEKPPAIEGSPA